MGATIPARLYSRSRRCDCYYSMTCGYIVNSGLLHCNTIVILFYFTGISKCICCVSVYMSIPAFRGAPSIPAWEWLERASGGMCSRLSSCFSSFCTTSLKEGLLSLAGCLKKNFFFEFHHYIAKTGHALQWGLFLLVLQVSDNGDCVYVGVCVVCVRQSFMQWHAQFS